MLTEYIKAAMHRAKYKLIGDGTFFGEIPGLNGLWANAETLEACRDELEESLEEWILLGLQLGHPICTQTIKFFTGKAPNSHSLVPV